MRKIVNDHKLLFIFISAAALTLTPTRVLHTEPVAPQAYDVGAAAALDRKPADPPEHVAVETAPIPIKLFDINYREGHFDAMGKFLSDKDDIPAGTYFDAHCGCYGDTRNPEHDVFTLRFSRASAGNKNPLFPSRYVEIENTLIALVQHPEKKLLQAKVVQANGVVEDRLYEGSFDDRDLYAYGKNKRGKLFLPEDLFPPEKIAGRFKIGQQLCDQIVADNRLTSQKPMDPKTRKVNDAAIQNEHARRNAFYRNLMDNAR